MTARLAALFAASAVLSAAPARADEADRGRKAITRLFVPAVATVRITAGNREVALGTVVDPAGLILTKGSELRRGTLFATFKDGTKYEAEYVGYHEPTDLALLKVDASDLPAVRFAPPTAVEVGNWVAAAGPESEPLAVGVVSAAVRRLYGLEAEVAKLNKGFLGIRVARDADAEAEGVVIGEVERGGGAWRAKLKPGDTILKVGSKTVKKFAELSKALEDFSPGDTVKVTYKRGDAEKNVEIDLIDNAQFDRAVFQNKMGGGLSSRRTGFPEVLMHDTVLAPEDCGGPLVDLDGRVLGINIARAGRVETWALPGDLVTKTLADLKAGKFPAPGKEKVSK
jgi:serine protease Do